MNTPDKATFIAEMHRLEVSPDDHYIRVYPSFVNFFKIREVITKDDFVIAANFTYGWMPTILNLSGADHEWQDAAKLLTSAKSTRMNSEGVANLVKHVNNSLVGVSKILHFANPRDHAIWDSRVYRYLAKQEPHDYRISKLDNFLRYLEICDEIAEWPELSSEVKSLSQKIGQDLTPFRAIELTMFFGGGRP